MVTCTQCQREIPEINQGKFCPFCGAQLGVEGAPGPGEAESPSAFPGPPESVLSPIGSGAPGDQSGRREYVHWEDRGRLGFLHAFSQTWSDATFRPTQFFRASPKIGDIGSPLLFAFLIGMVATLISSFWQYQLFDSFSQFSEMPEMEGFERFLGTGWNRGMLRFMVLGSPLWVVLSIFLRAAILHLMMIIVGGNRHGWEATFRAVNYSVGPQLFAIVPWCGDVVALFWWLVLTVIGLREMHETTAGRVLLALLLPFVLCCGALLLLVYRFAAWFSQVGSQI
ncbi:MAG: YIP1 family protein [bacterium]